LHNKILILINPYEMATLREVDSDHLKQTGCLKEKKIEKPSSGHVLLVPNRGGHLIGASLK